MPPPSLPKSTVPFSEMVDGSVNIPPFKQLAFTGAHMVQSCIMNWLNDHRPNDMMDKLIKLTNSEKSSSWAKLYKLRSRYTQSSISNSRKDSSVDHQPTDDELFWAYIGALLMNHDGKGNGYSETNQFIQGILDYEMKKGEGNNGSSQQNHVSPFQNHTSNSNGASTNNLVTSRNEKTGKSGKSGSGSDNDTANAVSKLHEAIAKTGVQFTWKTLSEGKTHDPTWIMELCIDGYKGTFQATDKNKKQAKIMAAKLALKDQRLVSFLKMSAKAQSA